MTALRTGGAPLSRATRALVLVHGRGGDAAGMLGLLERLGLPDVAGLAPEHPHRSWWPTSFLAPAAQMEGPLDEGLSAIRTAIAQAETAGLARDRIALLGFSQGACLALEFAAREGAGLGQVFGLSGGLVGRADRGAPSEALYGFADKTLDYGTDLSGTRARVSVHAEDPHIPLARARNSAAALRSLGADVTLDVTPGPGHAITEADATAIRSALNA
ncbi:MAG: alpha/beta hydrolase [Shimia sp.]